MSDPFSDFLSKGPDDTTADVDELLTAASRMRELSDVSADDYIIEYLPTGMCGIAPGWYQFMRHEHNAGNFTCLGGSAREVANDLHRSADALERHLNNPDLLNPLNVVEAQMAALKGDSDAETYMLAVVIKMRRSLGGNNRLDDFLRSLGE